MFLSKLRPKRSRTVLSHFDITLRLAALRHTSGERHDFMSSALPAAAETSRPSGGVRRSPGQSGGVGKVLTRKRT